jgi:hypothetical protein
MTNPVAVVALIKFLGAPFWPCIVSRDAIEAVIAEIDNEIVSRD